MSDIEHIRAAAERLNGHAVRTPLMCSPFLDDVASRKLWVKPECLQHTGSFKYRGGRSAVSALAPEIRSRGILAYSSGNHAQGVARAAAEFGVPCIIIMPNDAPSLKIDNTKALGAEVILYDRPNGESRESLGERVQAERGMTLIKPYDEVEVIAGQGTCGLEIAQQAKDLGIDRADVLVCCGGGGLTSGIALALEAEAPGLRVRPCEPEGFDDVTRSLVSGQRETNAQGAGNICDAILSPAPGTMTFPIMHRLSGPGIVVTEDEVLRAMALIFQRLKLVAEPGGAAAVAAALFHGDEIEGDAVICTISGGNVDADMFSRALAQGTA